MPTTTPDTAQLHPSLAGLIDLADPHRPPHPGGLPCGSLCVPACTAASAGDAPAEQLATSRGARS